MTSIATIRLNPGNVGFYDEISRIHLTLGHPEALVPSGTNCINLRRGVKAGTITIVEGSLGKDVPPLKVVQVGEKYYLASNVAEASKPVIKMDEVKAETKPTSKKEERPAPEKKQEEKKEESKKEEPAKEESKDNAKSNDNADDAKDLSSNDDDKQPAKKSRRTRGKKAAN